MPNYSKKIVYLSKAQYQELITNNSVTVNGVTVNYNENDIYVTPQAEPIIDVRVNETSVVTDNVADIPIASDSAPGVVKVRGSSDGLFIDSSNRICISAPSNAQYQLGGNNYRPVTTYGQHQSAFFGLAKAAGADMAALSSVTIGIYPDAQKAAIQNMLGITGLLSTEESSTATAAHAINSTFMMNGKLHRATTAIAIGDAVEVGTNCEIVKADEVFVKKTDIANNNNFGLVKIGNEGINITSAGNLRTVPAGDNSIKAGNINYNPIVPLSQHTAVFYGLSKVAGVDLANETVTLGTYPETSKAAIRSLIGAGTPLDIQIIGTSIVSSGVANFPQASTTTYGILKMSSNDTVKAGNDYYSALTPFRQHLSTFYGLAKAAGDTTQVSSNNEVGTYTNDAKTAIQTMLGTQAAIEVIRL